MTHHTGRISQVLRPTARRIVFGSSDEEISAELFKITQVDRAHVIMLAERGLLEAGRARSLLRCIERLRRAGFAPLRGREVTRGVYLLYEGYLIERLGAEVGGALQTARSRNDLKATTLRLSLREPYVRLLRESLRLQAVLLRRSERHARTTMPAYTHYQAAVPVTYGHYLAGVASALARDVGALLCLRAEINSSPLGSGAVGGTSVPIDPVRTASLLGFSRPLLNSLDAVASRDLVLRLLASAAVMGVTLSRLSSDLLLWTTAEYDFLQLPDYLVGSSSSMPQKRNAFLLEQAQAKSSSPLAAFVGAASAMHSTPFTNSVAVGTEAISYLWGALRQFTDAITLLRLVVADARPNAARMLERAVQGHTTATELANRLAAGGDLPFRAAHRLVGEIVTEADARGAALNDVAGELIGVDSPSLLSELDPASVARLSVFGGGPGPAALDTCLSKLRAGWAEQQQLMRVLAAEWRSAEAQLDQAQERLLAGASTRHG